MSQSQTSGGDERVATGSVAPLLRADRSAPSRYRLAAGLDSWRDDPRIAARGFSHRWRSVVEPGNGEDAFLDACSTATLLRSARLLDIGCGHGELAIALAARAADS